MTSVKCCAWDCQCRNQRFVLGLMETPFPTTVALLQHGFVLCLYVDVHVCA